MKELSARERKASHERFMACFNSLFVNSARLDDSLPDISGNNRYFQAVMSFSCTKHGGKYLCQWSCPHCKQNISCFCSA